MRDFDQLSDRINRFLSRFNLGWRDDDYDTYQPGLISRWQQRFERWQEDIVERRRRKQQDDANLSFLARIPFMNRLVNPDDYDGYVPDYHQEEGPQWDQLPSAETRLSPSETSQTAEPTPLGAEKPKTATPPPPIAAEEASELEDDMPHAEPSAGARDAADLDLAPLIAGGDQATLQRFYASKPPAKDAYALYHEYEKPIDLAIRQPDIPMAEMILAAWVQEASALQVLSYIVQHRDPQTSRKAISFMIAMLLTKHGLNPNISFPYQGRDMTLYEWSLESEYPKLARRLAQMGVKTDYLDRDTVQARVQAQRIEKPGIRSDHKKTHADDQNQDASASPSSTATDEKAADDEKPVDS